MSKAGIETIYGRKTFFRSKAFHVSKVSYGSKAFHGRKASHGSHTIIFGAVSFCLVLIAAICISGTLITYGRVRSKDPESQYWELEKVYVREIREFLANSGYENSGVNLTRITDEEGNRSYKMIIHHKRFGRLSGEEKATLEEELGSLFFLSEKGTFCHEFYIAY